MRKHFNMYGFTTEVHYLVSHEFVSRTHAHTTKHKSPVRGLQLRLHESDAPPESPGNDDDRHPARPVMSIFGRLLATATSNALNFSATRFHLSSSAAFPVFVLLFLSAPFPLPLLLCRPAQVPPDRQVCQAEPGHRRRPSVCPESGGGQNRHKGEEGQQVKMGEETPLASRHKGEEGQVILACCLLSHLHSHREDERVDAGDVRLRVAAREASRGRVRADGVRFAGLVLSLPARASSSYLKGVER